MGKGVLEVNLVDAKGLAGNDFLGVYSSDGSPLLVLLRSFSVADRPAFALPLQIRSTRT